MSNEEYMNRTKRLLLDKISEVKQADENLDDAAYFQKYSKNKQTRQSLLKERDNKRLDIEQMFDVVEDNVKTLAELVTKASRVPKKFNMEKSTFMTTNDAVAYASVFNELMNEGKNYELPTFVKLSNYDRLKWLYCEITGLGIPSNTQFTKELIKSIHDYGVPIELLPTSGVYYPLPKNTNFCVTTLGRKFDECSDSLSSHVDSFTTEKSTMPDKVYAVYQHLIRKYDNIRRNKKTKNLYQTTYRVDSGIDFWKQFSFVIQYWIHMSLTPEGNRATVVECWNIQSDYSLELQNIDLHHLLAINTDDKESNNNGDDSEEVDPPKFNNKKRKSVKRGGGHEGEDYDSSSDESASKKSSKSLAKRSRTR
ncbi:hypothetical protein AKO1_000942, partial [Acrasis kona]